ncbi:hypothetical protein MJH12_02710 [bacterium]|nr:hypothetical protein [bacterium]
MLVLVAVLQGIAISKDKVNPLFVASLSISRDFTLSNQEKIPKKLRTNISAKMYAVSMARPVKKAMVKVDFVEIESLTQIPDSPLTYEEEIKTESPT